MSVLALAFALAIIVIPVMAGCTSVRENPPQLTTDTTGSALENRACLFFCSVTGTFTGSPGRANNSGSARSTDSSSFTPDVKPTTVLRPASRKKGVVVVPVPVSPKKE